MPEQAEVAELAPEVGREHVLVVDLGGARRDLVGGEGAHRVAQHVDRLAEIEVQALTSCPSLPLQETCFCD